MHNRSRPGHTSIKLAAMEVKRFLIRNTSNQWMMDINAAEKKVEETMGKKEREMTIMRSTPRKAHF